MARLAIPKLSLPETRRWLPAVVLVLCLSLLGMIGIALFTAGADPESGPSALPTSTAAQGYQGLRRLLTERGHFVATNRFEDGAGEVTRGDIEIITLNNDGGVFLPASQHWDREEADEASSASSSSSSEAASRPRQRDSIAIRQFEGVPDKRRSDHILYNPLGRAVIVVAPKWVSGAARRKPRWGADPQPYTDQALRSVLTVLSPVSTQVPRRPQKDDNTGEGDSEGDEAHTEPPLQPEAPSGKRAYDDGERLHSWDRVRYDIRRSRIDGPVTLRGAAGQSLFTTLMPAGVITDLQSISGPNLTPLLLGPNGEVLISRVTVTDGRPQTKAPVYLVSDPDLLNNHILADPRKVVAALTIIEALGPADRQRPSVVFNLTFNNLAFDHSLLHALSRPPYIGVSLCILLLALGLTWSAFSRFGPPRLAEAGPALGRGVRILADNAARLMAIAVKETKLGPAYAQMIRDEVLKSRGHRLTAPDQSPDELADHISRIYGASQTYTALKAGAASIFTVHQLIDYARQLHAWREDIGKTETERANQ